MVIGIIGESCTGKGDLAERLKADLGGEIYIGNDYLKLAKDESVAKDIFKEKLEEAMVSDHNIIYVISEKDQVSLLPEEAIRVLATADINFIKDVYTERMKGNLSTAAREMLEREHGSFDGVKHDIQYKCEILDIEEVAKSVKNLIK